MSYAENEGYDGYDLLTESDSWVGLTRKEKMKIINSLHGEDMIYALDEVERLLKERNL